MFESQFENLSITLDEVKGSGMFILLYLIALFYLFINEKDIVKRRIFCYSSLIIIFVVMNPIFNKLVGGIYKKTIYWRFFWTLPMGISVAYVGVDVVSKLDEKRKRIFASIAIIILIIFSGKLIYNDTNYQKVDNLYKHTDEDVFIAHQIAIDDAEYKRIICPEKLNNHLRQIEPSLIMAYPRVASGDYEDYPIRDCINKGQVEEIDKFAKENDFNYVIFKKETELTAPMEAAGFHLIYETENYRIYKKS